MNGEKWNDDDPPIFPPVVRSESPEWIKVAAILIAGIALIGGLYWLSR